jgi:undecaprenyl-diphosphatase
LDYIQFIVLGLLQGVTEFLPISSSAHLILTPELLGWADQGLAIDLAAHVGTLAAVVSYFRRDLQQMLAAWFGSGFSTENPQSRYIWYLLIATVPVAIAGVLSADLVEGTLRSPLVIAGTTISFGLLLGWADYSGRRSRTESTLQWRDVLLIGLAQVLALVPGTSRSGITMTAGLMLGLNREAASRFSFLLSIPVSLLAGAYGLMKLIQSSETVDWTAVLIVTLVSAGTAFLTIHYFLKFLQRFGMTPYVIYRMLLGAILLFLFV